MENNFFPNKKTYFKMILRSYAFIIFVYDLTLIKQANLKKKKKMINDHTGGGGAERPNDKILS